MHLDAALDITHSEVTSFLPQYADPVADLLDKWGAFRARLFRESCVFHRGNYVKDLSRLGRDLRRVLILDNSPASYVFHPDNAVSTHETRRLRQDQSTCVVASPALCGVLAGTGIVLLPVSHIPLCLCMEGPHLWLGSPSDSLQSYQPWPANGAEGT